jgi:hypothetical protein
MDWWHGLAIEQQIFWSIALLSSLVLLLQLLGMMLGFEHGADIGHVDPGVSGDVSGVHVLSVRAVIAFAVGFGWAGVIALEGGWGIPVAIVLATVVGTVYVPIPAALAAGGQVEILIQGRVAMVNAATRGAVIPNRTRVKVVDLVDRTTLLVEPVV